MTTRTLTGNYSFGYKLSSAYTALVISATATIKGLSPIGGGAAGGYAVRVTFPATVTNSGSVTGGRGGQGDKASPGGAGGMGGDGLDLAAGILTNSAGFIVGGQGGVGGIGSVGSTGGVGGTGGDGVSGGFVYNVYNSAILSGGAGGTGGYSGIHAGAGGAGGAGLDLIGGGTVSNTGTISGGAGGAGGSTVDAGGHGGAGGAGVMLGAAGQIGNLGTIRGGAGGAGGSGTTIGNSGLAGMGVLLAKGGVVVNGSSASNTALIEGYVGIAVFVGATTVTNYGTIKGDGGGAVSFGSPGDRLIVENGSSLIGSVSGDGGTLELAGGSGTIDSTFSGFATYIVDAGAAWTLAATNAVNSGVTVTVDGTLINDASMSDGGLVQVGGVFANAGLITTAYGSTGAGVSLTSGGRLDNGGAVFGVGGGAGAKNGGYAGAGGSGGAGGAAVAVGANGYVSNTGSLHGGGGGAGGGSDSDVGGVGGAGGTGIQLSASGGAVANSGLIVGGVGGGGGKGGWVYAGSDGYGNNYYSPGPGGVGGAGGTGVLFASKGSLINTGTVLGGAGGAGGLDAAGAVKSASGVAGDGVDLVAGGAVINGSSLSSTALIEGVYGVRGGAGGPTTVTNFATIDGTGGVSVMFGATSDRLIIEAGSHFVGSVVGGGGTLELAGGSESLSGLGGVAGLTGSAAMTVTGFASYLVDAAAALTLVGANTLNAKDSLIDKGALSNAAAAALTVSSGSTAEVQGVVANAGTIALASAGSAAVLRVLEPGATLSGGGRVSLGGAKAHIVGSSTTTVLVNVDNTIVGAGSVGMGKLVLTNAAAGVIEATGVLDVRTSGSLTNAGLIEAVAGGIVDLISTTLIGAGTLEANGGTVNLEGATVIGGTLASTGSSAIRVNAGPVTFEGSKSAVMLTGAAQILGTRTLVIDGALINSGKLSLFAGTLTAGAAGITLSGGGQVILNGNAANAIGGTTTLTNLDNRITGSGNLGKGTLTLVNDGVIVDPHAGALTIDTGTHTIVNAGTIMATAAGGGVIVKSAVANSGQLQASSGGTLSLLGTVTGTGVARINGGTLYVADAFAETVTFVSATGVLKLGDSQGFTGKVAGLSGAGTNSLDLADIGYSKTATHATYSGTTASGTLTVTDGTHTAHIKLTGNYIGATFTLSGDGHGGTRIVDPALLAKAAALAPAPSAAVLIQANGSFASETGGEAALAIAPRTSEPWVLTHPHVETA
ncbi:MAG TPA: hypothetical protein VG166_05150 [Caulobacteraceae bacterium]|jgi:hypothetical protein|nr:hypothetical protein [Caulobacteraceae bacterium]